MLNKKNRLPIQGRLKTLTTIVSPLFIVKVAKNQEQKVRFAIVISKEVDKRAVYRNGLKRRLDMVIARNIKDIKQGHDFLIISKKEAVARKVGELEEELIRALKIEGLLL